MKVFHLNAPAPYYTNCFLLISDKGTAVAIDPSAAISTYTDLLEKNNAVLTDILLTHGHHDHVETLKVLKEQTNAKVHMAKEDSAFFSIDAESFFSDDKQIKIDEMVFSTIFTPGHTPGSSCIRCADLLFTGDTLFDGGIGRTDLPGGDTALIYKSLKKLVDVVTDNPKVIPGHESLSDMDTQKKHNHYLKF